MTPEEAIAYRSRPDVIAWRASIPANASPEWFANNPPPN
jgi:hypothetical protein